MLRYAFSYIIVAGKVFGQFLKRNKLTLILIAYLFLLSNVFTEKYYSKLEKYNLKQIDNSLIDEASNDTSIRSKRVHVRSSLVTTSTVPVKPVVESVDAVYTWVNGSDADFIRSYNESHLGIKSNPDDTGKGRFTDMNQMLYSLRSIEMYAPWIRDIFIVTNGQIPNWLNISHSSQDYLENVTCN